MIALENTNKEVTKAIKTYTNYICQEVQALKLDIENEVLDASEIEMDEYLLKLKIAVSK